MKDWLNIFFENHYWVKNLLLIVFFFLVWVVLKIKLKTWLSKISEEKRLRYNYLESVFFGFVVPIIGMFWWYYSSSETPINEFQLITNSRIVKGYIYKVEEHSDVVDYNEGRSSALIIEYSYDYKFKLPNGIEYISDGMEMGSIPEHLSEVEQNPYPVEVEYLENNPRICRVKDMPSNRKTIFEFLRFTVLGGVLVLLVCSSFSYVLIKNAKKECDYGKYKLKNKFNSK
jgi:hypothetical protein